MTWAGGEDEQYQELPFVFPTEPPRTGTHVSTLIKHLQAQIDPKTYGPKPMTDSLRATFERGFALEEMLKANRLWPRTVLLQVALEEDSIVGTLDGLDPTTGIIYESKCTLISSARPPTDEKFWGWRTQLKAYAHLANTRDAYLDVLHLCGDWNPPSTIPPRRIHWRFSDRAVSRNWDMLLRTRDRMVKKGLL